MNKLISLRARLIHCPKWHRFTVLHSIWSTLHNASFSSPSIFTRFPDLLWPGYISVPHMWFKVLPDPRCSNSSLGEICIWFCIQYYWTEFRYYLFSAFLNPVRSGLFYRGDFGNNNFTCQFTDKKNLAFLTEMKWTQEDWVSSRLYFVWTQIFVT